MPREDGMRHLLIEGRAVYGTYVSCLNIGIEGLVVHIKSKSRAKRQVKVAQELPRATETSAGEAKLGNGVLV